MSLSQEILKMTYSELLDFWLNFRLQHSYLDLEKGGNHIVKEHRAFEKKLHERVNYFQKLIAKVNVAYTVNCDSMTIHDLKRLINSI